MTKSPRKTPTRTIEIVAFPDVQLLDVTGPLQVFASANEISRVSGQPAPYAIRLVAKASPVVSSCGLAVLAQGLSSQQRPIDTLIVAGGAGVHEASRDKRLISWLAERASAARRVASVCTGAFVLGAAGLLNGKRVVTHWAECERLARCYPKARVEIDLARHHVPLSIQADRIQIEQVVLNLVQNAFEAVRERKVRVQAIRVRVSRHLSGEAKVTVEDSGPGIPAEVAASMFEPFFTTKPSGLGMGLAIARSIVQSHHGRLWFERRRRPQGAEVSFSLPLAEEPRRKRSHGPPTHRVRSRR
jgi:signal transduction histidine kinase